MIPLTLSKAVMFYDHQEELEKHKASLHQFEYIEALIILAYRLILLL